MKKLSLLLPIAGFLAYLTLSSSSSGITGQSTAGCGGGSCHGGGASTATQLIISHNIPAGGWTAGTTYTMTVSVAHASQSRAGFNLSANVGAFSNAGPGAQIVASQLTHNSPKALTSGSASWTCSWTAPAASSTATSVTFSMAGNAVNFNSQQTGDVWNTTSLNVQKAITPPAAPTVSVNGTTFVCGVGPYPTLTASSTGASSYAWFNGTTQVPGVTTAAFQPTAPGAYTATAANSGGSSTASAPVNIATVTNLPASFTLTNTVGSSYSFSYPNASLSYQWTFGEAGATSTLQNPSYTYTTSGAKTVKLVVTNGGGGCRDSTTQTLNVTLDIGSVAGIAGFSYGPNPTHGSLMLWTGALKADVRIRNLAGKTVATLRTRDEATTEKTVSIAHLAAGLYFLEVETDHARGVDKLIVR